MLVHWTLQHPNLLIHLKREIGTADGDLADYLSRYCNVHRTSPEGMIIGPKGFFDLRVIDRVATV